MKHSILYILLMINLLLQVGSNVTIISSIRFAIEYPGTFGSSVSLKGNSLVIGAPGADALSTDSGVVSIYERNNNGDNKWGEVKRLSGLSGFTGFGTSVSLDNDVLAVGSVIYDKIGAVHVFYRNLGGINNWGHVTTLLPNRRNEGGGFGATVALSGDVLVVGAPYDDSIAKFCGAVYVYSKNQGGTDKWGEVVKIQPSNPSNTRQFGSKVSLSGNLIAVSESNLANPGIINLYDRDKGGLNNWGLFKSFISDIGDGSYLTNPVIQNNVIAIARTINERSVGVNVYTQNMGGISNWGLAARLISEDYTIGDNFGSSISIDVDKIVIGANQRSEYGWLSGAAYIFKRSNDSNNDWKQIAKLKPVDIESYFRFGSSVSSNGDIVVGAPDAVRGYGLAYLFAFNNNGGSTTVAGVSAASYRTSDIAPDSIVALFGGKISFLSDVAKTQPLPLRLGDTTVTVTDSSGSQSLSSLFYVSPTQINMLIPQGIKTGKAYIQIESGGSLLSSGILEIKEYAPSLFSANADGLGAAAAIILRIDTLSGRTNYESTFIYSPVLNKWVTRAIDLGSNTDEVYLLLFGTGIRNRPSIDRIPVIVDGKAVDVYYAGPQPEYAGLDQVNIKLPRNLIGRGEIDVVVGTSNVLKVRIL